MLVTADGVILGAENGTLFYAYDTLAYPGKPVDLMARLRSTKDMSGIAGVTLAFERISGWLIEGLAAVGVPGVTRQGVSDLVLDDRKIGGSCIYRRRDLLYYSTTVLLTPRLELMERSP